MIRSKIKLHNKKPLLINPIMASILLDNFIICMASIRHIQTFIAVVCPNTLDTATYSNRIQEE